MLSTKVIDNSECSRDIIVDVVNHNSFSLDSLAGEVIQLNQLVNDLMNENGRLRQQIDYLIWELDNKQDKEPNNG